MTTTATTPRIRLPWRPGLSATRLPATRHVEPRGGEEGAVIGRLPRRWAPRSADSVAQSWRRQVLLVRVGGTTVRIQARLDEDAYGGVRGDQGEHHWPFAGDVLIAGSARGPIAYLAGELHTGRDALRGQAETYLVRTAPADLIDRGHAWTEPATIATGRSSASPIRPDWPERFLEACGRLGIETVVRIRDGQWQVLSLTGGDVDDARVVSSDPCSVTRDVDRRCALLRAPEKGEYCRMRGGPWVRRSIEASLAWKHHRAQLTGPLGCDTCDGVRYLFQDQVREGGGPIGLVELAVPTRWLVALEE